MTESVALRIYSQDSEKTWKFQSLEDLPVARPSIIVIHVNDAAAQSSADRLLNALEQLLDQVGGTKADAGTEPWPKLDSSGTNYLHVIVCDGVNLASADTDVLASVSASDTAWILPVMSRSAADSVSALLDGELRKRNIAFWEKDIDEVALVILARAGVTSLDRRIFISYRRVETSAMADQLFDALTQRNFQVFLDRISVDPGVNFQAKLFEHLADKSMVVLLHSKTFSTSPWTKAELEFARERQLSVRILRLPGVSDDLGAEGSEPMLLEEADLEFISVAGGDEPQKQLCLPALEKVVGQIVYQHDLDLIGRVRNIRERIVQALEGAAKSHRFIRYTASRCDASINLEMESENGDVQHYSIHPSAYPPGVPGLYDVSLKCNNPNAKLRVVVGHTSSLAPLRAKQLDWIVDKRNVNYHDVGSVPNLIDSLIQGKI